MVLLLLDDEFDWDWVKDKEDETAALALIKLFVNEATAERGDGVWLLLGNWLLKLLLGVLTVAAAAVAVADKKFSFIIIFLNIYRQYKKNKWKNE